MASKYDVLADHLRGRRQSPYTMNSVEIDRLIEGGLPATDRKQREWSDNDRSITNRHYQSKRGWLAAGWEVMQAELNLIGMTVTFRT